LLLKLIEYLNVKILTYVPSNALGNTMPVLYVHTVCMYLDRSCILTSTDGYLYGVNSGLPFENVEYLMSRLLI